jgi:HlyD family secretion protein
MGKGGGRIALLAGLLAVAGLLGWREWKARRASALPAGIVSGNGRIESVQVDVATKYGGRLVNLLVKEGDLVQPGEVVAHIDTAEVEAQLASGKAKVAEARATVAKIRADILQSESNATLSEQNYARGRALFQRAAIARQEYDELLTKRNADHAAVESLKAQLEAALSSVETQLSEAHRYEVQIADSTLMSPVRGRVLYKLAEEGEVLAAGGKALTLINLGDVYMEIYLPSREAALIDIGADARIVLDAVPQYAAPARVSFVSPETQFTPKQVETPSERDKLMFRVKLQVPPELILRHIEKVKTGVRGVGYVQVDKSVPWPERLERRFPEKVDVTKPAEPTGPAEAAPAGSGPDTKGSSRPMEEPKSGAAVKSGDASGHGDAPTSGAHR